MLLCVADREFHATLLITPTQAYAGSRLVKLNEHLDFVRIGQKAQTAALEPEPINLEEEIQTRASRIRRLSPSERMRAQMELSARIATMERNVKNGYLDWQPQLELDRRVLELSSIGAW